MRTTNRRELSAWTVSALVGSILLVLGACSAARSSASLAPASSGRIASIPGTGDGRVVALGALQDDNEKGAVETVTRSITKTFKVEEKSTWRLFNLAGAIKLVQGDDDTVTVEATIHAGADDQKARALMDGMSWTTRTGRNDHVYNMLDFPLDDEQAYHYPQPKGAGNNSHSNVFGHSVTVSSKRTDDSVTLYADLTITYPESIHINVRNLVGEIAGGKLAGNLSAETGSGTIRIDEFDGDLTLDTGSGDITLGAVRGDFDADTGSGDVVVESLEGDGSIDTGSGAIEVRAIRSDAFDADTGSGSITLRHGRAGDVSLDTGSGAVELDDVEFKTLDIGAASGSVVITSSLAGAESISCDLASGGVTIKTDPDASFTLEADTMSGGLHVGFDDAVVHRRGHSYRVKRGEGGPDIDIETMSGGVTIGPRGKE